MSFVCEIQKHYTKSYGKNLHVAVVWGAYFNKNVYRLIYPYILRRYVISTKIESIDGVDRMQPLKTLTVRARTCTLIRQFVKQILQLHDKHNLFCHKRQVTVGTNSTQVRTRRYANDCGAIAA